MNNNKQCRNCKETIAEEAKWCPHCHRPQSIIRAILPPQAIAVVIIAIGGYWYLTYAAMEDTFSQIRPEIIYGGGDQLEIAESSFDISPSKSGCESCIYIIGSVKNNTETAWSNIHFEVTYMDENGKTIDVINDDDSDFVVGPNTAGEFKISGKASADLSKYKTHEIKITKASPDTGWY
jgi:hypothetical protein